MDSIMHMFKQSVKDETLPQESLFYSDLPE